MKVVNPQVNGNQVTYDVMAENFNEMVAMQYGINYDTTQLAFVRLQNMAMEDLDMGDFNAANAGTILNVWLHTSLEGVTMGEDEPIYQIVFEMLNGTPGDVCFSEDVLLSEFINVSSELMSFSVVDDCYSEPHEILLTLSVAELEEQYGLYISTKAGANAIPFRLKQPQVLSFQLVDISGRMVRSFPKEPWPVGPHALYFRDGLIAGMYILNIGIDDKSCAVKILVEE